MKNIKLRSILFSLMAITTITLFLSSCNKDEHISSKQNNFENVIQDESNFEKMHLFFNNEDFANKSEAEIIEYIENLNAAELTSSKNDYLVAEYLTNTNLFNIVLSETDTESLSEVDLSIHVIRFVIKLFG